VAPDGEQFVDVRAVVGRRVCVVGRVADRGAGLGPLRVEIVGEEEAGGLAEGAPRLEPERAAGEVDLVAVEGVLIIGDVEGAGEGDRQHLGDTGEPEPLDLSLVLGGRGGRSLGPGIDVAVFQERVAELVELRIDGVAGGAFRLMLAAEGGDGIGVFGKAQLQERKHKNREQGQNGAFHRGH